MCLDYYETYFFEKLPQGLKTATGIFVDGIHEVFKKLLDFVIPYMDDCGVGSDSDKQMFIRLKEFFQTAELQRVGKKRSDFTEIKTSKNCKRFFIRMPLESAWSEKLLTHSRKFEFDGPRRPSNSNLPE